MGLWLVRRKYVYIVFTIYCTRYFTYSSNNWINIRLEEQMKELFILAVLVMAILIYEIIQTKKENKILKNNYNTALKILSDSDPKLREYLENKD